MFCMNIKKSIWPKYFHVCSKILMWLWQLGVLPHWAQAASCIKINLKALFLPEDMQEHEVKHAVWKTSSNWKKIIFPYPKPQQTITQLYAKSVTKTLRVHFLASPAMTAATVSESFVLQVDWLVRPLSTDSELLCALSSAKQQLRKQNTWTVWMSHIPSPIRWKLYEPTHSCSVRKSTQWWKELPAPCGELMLPHQKSAALEKWARDCACLLCLRTFARRRKCWSFDSVMKDLNRREQRSWGLSGNGEMVTVMTSAEQANRLPVNLFIPSIHKQTKKNLLCAKSCTNRAFWLSD